ncbi:MAG: tetratricopeptide repeat protein [Myxococcales bacterium]|nr:tetratricopeptide repeat protein [Myxococcales bacterium]
MSKGDLIGARRLLQNPHFFGTATLHLRQLAEGLPEIMTAIDAARAAITAGTSRQRAAFDLLMTHEAVKLAALFAELPEADRLYLLAVAEADAAQRAAVARVMSALDAPLRAGLRLAAPELAEIPALTGYATVPPPADVAAPGELRSNLPPRAPFFGRADALDQLARWLHPADRAWGVLIDGPGGIGKTALAVEAAYRAPSEDYPLKLWVTAKTRTLHPDGERPIPGSHPQDFTAIIDAFARAIDRDDLPRLAPDARPAALHAALAPHHALLVIDNLEGLATPERRRVLEWLNRLPAGCRAIVTSRRRDDSLAGHALRVDQLDRRAATQLLAALGERQPAVAALTDAERDRLYDETGGNPQLLTWIAGQLDREGGAATVDEAISRLHDADRRADAEGNDPLAYVFGDLVQSFTLAETAVLAALAHFTRPARVAWLLPMTGLSRRVVEDALDGLRDRALLIEDEAAGTWLLPPLAAGYLRRVRPEAVGEAGERLADEVLALVWENGGRQHDRIPVLDAEWPQIEAALPVLLAGDNRRLQAVCDALHMFLDYTGRWDERLALSEAAEARAHDAGDLYNAGWRAHDAGWCHYRRGQAAPVLAAAERAAAHWRAAGDPARERATALRVGALGHHLAGDHGAALAASEAALALLRARDPISLGVAVALSDVADSPVKLGRHDEAEARCREALALARRLRHAEGVATCTGKLAALVLDRSRPADAEALAREALALAEPLGRRELIAGCCTHLARALAAQGRGAEGRPYAERAVDILTALRAPDLPKAQAALAACTTAPPTPQPD